MNHMSKDPAMGNSNFELIDHQFYPTPAWMTEGMLSVFADRIKGSVLEPACGEGHVSEVLIENGFDTYSSDLIDRGYGQSGVDFLKRKLLPHDVKAIITNPPYGAMAEKFVKKALELTKPVEGVVIMCMRNEYDCAKGRADLFGNHGAYAGKAIATSRPRWVEGTTGSPRHNYAWYLWDWSEYGKVPVIRYFHKPKRATAAGNRTLN